MAIIIPSKNIYDKQNPKIRNNLIDTINTKTSSLNIVPTYDMEVNSFQTYDISSKFDSDTISQNYKENTTQYGTTIDFVASIIRPKYQQYTLTFDKISSDRKIQKINTERLNISIFGTKRIGNAKATIQINPNDNNNKGWHIVGMQGINDTQVLTNEYLYFPELKVSTSYEGFETVVAEAENRQKLENLTIEETSFKALCTCLVGLETYSFAGRSAIGTDENTGLPIARIDGTYEIYEPQRVEIQIFGDYIKLENTELPIEYGNGQNIFTIENNELFQEASKYQGNSATHRLSEETIRNYSNGKETAELLCSISEYYDENGNLVISTKNNGLPMLFEKGDVAIPMTFSPQGEDIPMSRNKEFTVVGVEPIYDGAVWQRLTLQEK